MSLEEDLKINLQVFFRLIFERNKTEVEI